MQYKTIVICSVGTLTLQLGGCGGSDGSEGFSGASGVRAIVSVTGEPAGDNCPAGGSRVTFGRDVNGNRKLETTEVSGVEFVCDGPEGGVGSDGKTGVVGVDGPSGTLSGVRVTDEEPGPNCANGGSRIEIGADADADGVPDADAVLSTSYVCNGGDGATGSDAALLLVNVASEPAGTHCPDGGKRVSYGLDENHSGTLGSAEMLGISYVCHGDPVGDGSRGLVTVTPVESGQACSAGGDRIDYGQDGNQNGVLDSAEIAGTRYVCKGATGANGKLALFRVSSEAAGANCFHSGKRVDVGLDTDADQVLDSEEITQTRYVCDGLPGADGNFGLVAVVAEPPGAHCTSGGYKLDSGFDANGNAVLDSGEIAGSTYICAGDDGADGSDARTRTGLVRVSAEPAGAACAAGGQRIDSGIDSSGDGTLDPAEIRDTDYVCAGADGADGLDGAKGRENLIKISAEPAGASCAAGGRRVDTGLDANGDGSLAVGEISLTRYVCNARAGTNGSNGAAGLDALETLVLVAAEPAGASCALGGQRIDYGLDDNRDSALAGAEIDGSRYVCNGASGGAGAAGTTAVNSVVATAAEPAGGNCANGGQRIDYGLDDSGNGALEPAEIDGSRYICNGANGGAGSSGSNAVNSLVTVTAEPAGINCAAAGRQIRYGLDDNGDGTLAPAEVDDSRYVCNGAAGSPGTNATSNGTNGLKSLVSVAVEPIGTNCRAGGHRIQVGFDADDDATLAAGEIDSTSYVCDFAVIVNGSFETGDYAGWTFLASTTRGIWGNLANNTAVPFGGTVFDYKTSTNKTTSSSNLPFTYNSTDGTRVAVLFQSATDAHRIYQTVTVPATATTLNWDMYYRNFTNFTATTQFFAVNLRDAGTDAIVATLFKTAPGDPVLVASMTPFSASVVAFRGMTLRLDFHAEVQITFFPVALDHIRFE